MARFHQKSLGNNSVKFCKKPCRNAFSFFFFYFHSVVVSQLQPESPTTAMDTSTAAQASSITDPFLAAPKPPPTTTSLIPSHVKIGGSADMSGWSKEYLSAINVIGSLSECSNILALPSARCPIIRFTL